MLVTRALLVSTSWSLVRVSAGTRAWKRAGKKARLTDVTGRMFECGKFLKHSLQHVYIAGLGREVGKKKVWRNRLAIFSSDDILAAEHSPIRLAVL
jgi:hypothetical protein